MDRPRESLLLSGENMTTYDQGFFRGSIDGGEPKQLVMAAKAFSAPVKAKDADVYLLTGQTFKRVSDLLTTDGTFKELRKVSDANRKNWFPVGQCGTGAVQECRRRGAQAALYKPENFDPRRNIR